MSYVLHEVLLSTVVFILSEVVTFYLVFARLVSNEFDLACGEEYDFIRRCSLY